MRAHLAVLSAAFACASLASGRALAVERQWHAGVGAGGAWLAEDGATTGFGGGAHLTYGLTDQLNLLVQADASRARGVDATILSGTAGAAYVLDVLRWVPYVGVLGGAYHLSGPLAFTSPGAAIAAGVDYQLDRSFAVGLQLRQHMIFGPEDTGTVGLSTAFLRCETTWGF